MEQKNENDAGRHRGPRVLFGQREALSRDLPSNTMLIVPSRDTWNDFGHHTRIDYQIRVRAEGQPVSASGFIGFIEPEGNRNGKDFLEQLVATKGEATVPAMSEHRFFTMLPCLEAW